MASITEALKVALGDRYVIEEEVGAGGMATVYLAHDIKHDRNVALKVLRPELAAVIGAERFLNEIKVTANLQHPHILPLHDSGEADTFLYYVMPFVEDDTLRDKLSREKQLGIDDAIEITRGVASALDYAHRQGVIHRDIKPENILIHDDQPLVADFGIALAVSAAGGSRLTETGLSIGTPHYMSPEQAMGDRELDARSDVYSLGAMLYEMLTGDPPYQGNTAQAIVAKVITEKATPVTVTRDTVPVHVDVAIQKALAKLPADRFSSASDFSEALMRPGSVTLQPTAVAPEVAAPKSSSRNLLGWAAVLALAVAVAAMGWMRRTPEPEPVRLDVTLPDFAGSPFGPSMAISSDGSVLVYLASVDAGGTPLVVRRLSQLGTTPLTGTQDGLIPFLSPDGQHVGYLADQSQIRRVPVIGGPPITVADSAGGSGTWGDDGYIYFTHASTGIARVPEDGGTIEVLTQSDTASAVFAQSWLDALPGARGIIYTDLRFPLPNSDIAVLDLETRESRVLFRGTYARYAESGHLVYTRADGALMAVPFDAGRLEIVGSPVALVEGVPIKTFGSAEFALSQSGTLIYGIGIGRSGVALVDRAGTERLIPGIEQSLLYPRVSPDGTRLALEGQGTTGNDIWTYNLRDSTLSRLTFEGFNIYPEWLPDGRTISFSRSESSGSPDRNIFIKPADGSGQAEVVAQLPQSQVEGLWSPDGEWLILRQGDRGRGQNANLTALRLGTSEEPIEILSTPFMERSPALSPDGRWLAYASGESGRDEVYVRPFPGPGGRWQISTSGGGEPRWAHSGRELFYRSGNDLISVEVRTEPSFEVGTRKRLFSAGGYLLNPNHAGYDVFPDDQTFVFVHSVGEAQRTVMVLNWFGELRRRTED
jgi:serine/threonine-protein kinase